MSGILAAYVDLPALGVRPLGPFTLRTEGITRPVPHHRVAHEPADVNVIPARPRPT